MVFKMRYWKKGSVLLKAALSYLTSVVAVSYIFYDLSMEKGATLKPDHESIKSPPSRVNNDAVVVNKVREQLSSQHSETGLEERSKHGDTRFDDVVLYGDQIRNPTSDDKMQTILPLSNLTCNLSRIMASSYLKQFKSVSTCRHGNGVYRVECDPKLTKLIDIVLERLNSTSPTLWQSIQNLQSSFLKFGLRSVEKWKALTDALNMCGYEQRLPDVINIGVKKSGTSMFSDVFANHPQIARALPGALAGEVHFFDWDYGKGIEYHRSRMMFASSDMLSYEKTPKYFRTKDAPFNMAKDLPDHVKFILLVKDPVKRAISEFRHEQKIKRYKRILPHQQRTPTERSETISFEKEVLHEDGKVNEKSEIIDTSIYSKHFANWLEIYPREKFLIIEYDQLVQNMSYWLQKVEKFLGLHSYFRPEMFALFGQNGRACFDPLPLTRKSKKTCSIPKELIPKAKPSKETLLKLCRFYQPYNEKFMRLTNMVFNWTCAG